MQTFESINFTEIGALIKSMADNASPENPYMVVDLSNVNPKYIGEVATQDLSALASWGGTVIYGPNSANDPKNADTNEAVYRFSEILRSANIPTKHVENPASHEQINNVIEGKHWTGNLGEA